MTNTISEETSDTVITDFMLDAFTNAAGILSQLMGGTTDWESVAYMPKTLIAIRSMPPNFQNEIAKPILAGLFEEVGIDTSDAQYGLALDYDQIFAAIVTDAYSLAMQSLQTQPQRSSTLVRPRPRDLYM